MIELSQRIRVELRGAVQGVGFRPFVYRLAQELGLGGFVQNTTRGATIEIEGSTKAIQSFLNHLEQDKPPQCRIEQLLKSDVTAVGGQGFVIQPSDEQGDKGTRILADLATCGDCRRELFDPANRRYRYPFINCTNCGPRFSIIEAIPYDRQHTTMKAFRLCDLCRTEYESPGDRRFHAQPNACPECGPHMEIWDFEGRVLATHEHALLEASDAIRQGDIVAVKGLGGFHLMVDARDDGAVRRLRHRKARDEKPFALMFPRLAKVEQHCVVAPEERRWLTSAQAPMVLLRQLPPGSGSGIAESVAPGNPYLGVMLPYTPLHHLLLADLGFPVVATSGNLAEEPICTDESEARVRLRNIADVLLVHNRPIARPMEDSVMQVVLGKEQLLRAGRGFAPLSFQLTEPMPPILAVGGHLKNTVAVAVEDQAILNQHIGDLETAEAHKAFHQTLVDLPRLYDLQPTSVVCDLHPDYASTHAAQAMGLPVIPVQHHEAHIRACMAEHGLVGNVLGVAWDGTGYGSDGTVWGGEFLHVQAKTCRRVAYFRPFRLPGGGQAIREPRRAALGILFELFGESVFQQTDLAPIRSFSANECNVLRTMLCKDVQSPRTTSVGRLFDAAASLCGIRQVSSFEGQAAMELEFAADDGAHATPSSAASATAESVRYSLVHTPDGMIDWAPMFMEMIGDIRQGIAAAVVSAKFHNSLVNAMVNVARQVGERRVVLGGGCFQNRRLLEGAVTQLRAAGFEPYWPQRVPPNDGGLALGQIAALVVSAESTNVPRGSGTDR